MTEPTLEQRIDRLEDLMVELARAASRTQRQVEQTSRDVSRTSRELRAFRDEMAVYRDTSHLEMRERRERFTAEMQERQVRTDREVREHREAVDRAILEQRRQWGELSNRLGTMAEDLVAPSIPRILRTVIGCPEDHIDSLAVRMRRRSTVDPGRKIEFDVVATCGEHVLINETKSRLVANDIGEFLARLQTVRDYFPEFHGRKIIGALASLYVDESLVRAAEKQGLVVLGFGQDVMDVLNAPGFVPRSF